MSAYRQPAESRAPDVLVCSGLDPSGGAGFIADVRVVAELGGRPCGVVTALTVQNTTGVIGSHPCDPELVGHELAFLLSDIEVKAVKLGMIGSVDVARAIANALQLTAAPVIWDPVLYPSRGEQPLGDERHADTMLALAPHLALVTPNQRELGVLTGLPTDTFEQAEVAGRALAAQLDAAVLVKGGHFGGDESNDVLVTRATREVLRGPRVAGGEHVHGTGCALSAAIAAYCAHDRELIEACGLAKQYVADLIAHPVLPGRGAAAVR